jgi:hypothetical protein
VSTSTEDTQHLERRRRLKVAGVLFRARGSVSERHWFRCGSGSAFCVNADPVPDGCKKSVLRIRDVYVGSDFFPSRNRTVSISILYILIFNPKKCFLSSRKYDPGCSSRIRSVTLQKNYSAEKLLFSYPYASKKDVHCQSYRRSLQPSKVNIQHLRTPSWNQIRIQTTKINPDPKHW